MTDLTTLKGMLWAEAQAHGRVTMTPHVLRELLDAMTDEKKGDREGALTDMLAASQRAHQRIAAERDALMAYALAAEDEIRTRFAMTDGYIDSDRSANERIGVMRRDANVAHLFDPT